MQKEYEQIIRTPFVFQQAKPALWKAPLLQSFLLFSDIAFSDKRNIVRRKDNFPIDSETVKQLIDGFA
jgi:hypothetical protein